MVGVMALYSFVQGQLANMKYASIKLLPFDCPEGRFHALFPKPTDEVKSYSDIDTALDSAGETRPKKSDMAQDPEAPAPVYHYWKYEFPDGVWALAYQDHPEMMGHLNDVTKAFDTNLERSVAKIMKVMEKKNTGGTCVRQNTENKSFAGKYPSRTISGYWNRTPPKIVEQTPEVTKIRLYTARSGGDIDFRARAVAVKDHVYMLGAAGDRAFVYSSASDRFLDSLKPDE